MNTYNDVQLNDCKLKCNVTSLEEIDLNNIPLCTGTFDVFLVNSSGETSRLSEVAGTLLNVVVALNKVNHEKELIQKSKI